MPTSEKMLQTHAVAELMKMQIAGVPILFAGDMAGSRRTPAEALWAKATGLVRGEPDLRVYGPGGRILLIEMKAVGGVLSEHQIDRHERLRELGHRVETIHPRTGEAAAAAVRALVEGWL